MAHVISSTAHLISAGCLVASLATLIGTLVMLDKHHHLTAIILGSASGFFCCWALACGCIYRTGHHHHSDETKPFVHA